MMTTQVHSISGLKRKAWMEPEPEEGNHDPFRPSTSKRTNGGLRVGWSGFHCLSCVWDTAALGLTSGTLP